MLLGDARAAANVARLLEDAHDQHFVYPQNLTVIARHLGEAAALQGDRAAAHGYYDEALEMAGRIRHRPEIALTHLALAELLLDEALTSTLSQGEREQQRAEPLGHLDFAIEEFRAMKMHPSLERALRHKGLLHA